MIVIFKTSVSFLIKALLNVKGTKGEVNQTWSFSSNLPDNLRDESSGFVLHSPSIVPFRHRPGVGSCYRLKRKQKSGHTLYTAPPTGQKSQRRDGDQYYTWSLPIRNEYVTWIHFHRFQHGFLPLKSIYIDSMKSQIKVHLGQFAMT